MKNFLYICFLFLVDNVFLMAQEKENNEQSSPYTEQYITDIYMTEPDRALLLLDEAEEKRAMLPARRGAILYRVKVLQRFETVSA